MSDFRPPERKKNAFDNKKLNLSAPNSKGKKATLSFALVNNNPRINVYTNDPDDTIDNGRISANMDTPTLFAMLHLLSQACRSKEAFREKINNQNHTYQGGQRSDKAVVVSSTIIGKDDDGIIYISVTAPNRPIIKFVFGPSEYHNFIHGNGSPWTPAELSKLYAEAYIAMLTSFIGSVQDSQYVEPKPANNQKSNGYQNRSGGYQGKSGGYQKGNYQQNRNQGNSDQNQTATSESSEFDDWPG